MSEPTQPQQLTHEQRQALLNKLFQGLHSDLGAVARLISSNPQAEGFLLDSTAVGVAQMRLTRGMAAVEQLLRMNGGLPAKPAANEAGMQPGVAKDGALVATFAPAPAADSPTLKALDSAFEGSALVNTTNLGTIGSANGS